MVRDQVLRLTGDGDEFANPQVAPREFGDEPPPQRVVDQPDELRWRRVLDGAHVANIHQIELM